MSCIAKLIKKQRDSQPFYLDDKMLFVTGAEYRGYYYCITMSTIGIRYGHVSVHPNHPYYYFSEDKECINSGSKKAYELDIDGRFCAFGSVRFRIPAKALNQLVDFKTEKWLTFDLHDTEAFDIEAVKTYFPESYIDAVQDSFDPESPKQDYDIPTVDQIIDNCKRVIDQLIEHEPPKRKAV